MNESAGTTGSNTLDFEPLFLLHSEPEPSASDSSVVQPDRRDGAIYAMTTELHLAVETALITGRPLLLRGEPGTGKSSLAPYVARRLGWRYYEQVITSQTTAEDLLYRFDAVRRLGHAQVPGLLKPDQHYLEPGVLWWAFDRRSAMARGGADAPETEEPFAAVNSRRDRNRAVVLIDEIDKAHPDVPNGLLTVLGSNRFDVPYLNAPVEAQPPTDTASTPAETSSLLIVLTTNRERELPPAFVRRCLVWTLSHPEPDQLVQIARWHFDTTSRPFDGADSELALQLARRLTELRAAARPLARRPSTAEFLDAFRACRVRNVRPDATDPEWQIIEQLTLAKPDESPF